MSDAAPGQFGRYRVVGELGRGAMGVVFKAEDPMLNRTVAIKTILMAADPAERAEYEARFYQEGKAAGGLNHPNIITIHDIGREGDMVWMAMELLEGVELRDLMQKSRLPLAAALDIVAQVAEGLALAHTQGVVHRDIKPGNIMIVRGRQAKIMDFGIARVRLSDVKTQTGVMLGSPKYMSPEQVTGLAIDHRSDIFSLGVVLYELVAGVPPFAAADVAQLMYHVTRTRPRAPSEINPAVPTMLDLIVARALEKDPGSRYQDAGELAADLLACRAQLPAAPDVPVAAEEVAIDFDLEATAPLEIGSAQPPASASETAKTVKLGVAGSDDKTVKVGVAPSQDKTAKLGVAASHDDSGMRLSPSRRFESAEALERLVRLSASGGGSVETTLTLSSRRNLVARRWKLAAAIAAACVVAIAIAIL